MFAKGRAEGSGLKPRAVEMAARLNIRLKLHKEIRGGFKCVTMYRNGVAWFHEQKIDRAWGEAIERMKGEL